MKNEPKNEMVLIFLGLTLEKVSVAFYTFLVMEIRSYRVHLTYVIIAENGSGLTLTFNLQTA